MHLMRQVFHQTNTYKNPPVNLGFADLLNRMQAEIDPQSWGQDGRWGVAWMTIESNSYISNMQNEDNIARGKENAIADAFRMARYTAHVVDNKASSLNGEITFTVEATDDGQAYVTVGSQN